MKKQVYSKITKVKIWTGNVDFNICTKSDEILVQATGLSVLKTELWDCS
jgi:hypothetical protein